MHRFLVPVYICANRGFYSEHEAASEPWLRITHLQRGHQLSDSTRGLNRSQLLYQRFLAYYTIVHLIIFMIQGSFPPAAVLHYVLLFWRSMETEQLLHTTFHTPAGCLCSSGHERARFSYPQPPPTSRSNYSSVNRAFYTLKKAFPWAQWFKSGKNVTFRCEGSSDSYTFAAPQFTHYPS